MLRRGIITMLALLMPLAAQDSSLSISSAINTIGGTILPRQFTWMGFDTGMIDPATRSQLPKLPSGIGFLISKVEPNSPAQKAGLLASDILWKFDDQLLINKAQFIVLLQMHKPNDEVKLTLFRGGEEKILTLILGATPAMQKTAAGPTLESLRGEKPMTTALPEQPLPTIGTSSGETDTNDQRSASIDDGDHTLEMELRDEGPWLTITDENNQIAYDDLADDAHMAKIPAKWKNQVISLRSILLLKKENPVVPNPMKVKTTAPQ